MQKKVILTGIYFIAAGFLLSGCLMRSYSVKKDRVDQGISGNCGYVMGTPKESQKQSPAKTQRQTYVVEIELGKH